MSIETEQSASTKRTTSWLSRGLEALVEDRCLEDTGALPPKEDHFDIVIVGSGYGGAVAAAELSGCKDANGERLAICVLERGEEYLAGSFPSRMADLAGQVRFATAQAKRQRGVFDGLFDLRCSADAVALVACGLGGGSLINAGVMEMPIEQVFKEARWPHEIRAEAKTIIDAGSRLRDSWLGAVPIERNLDRSLLAKARALHCLNGGEKYSHTKVTISDQGGANSAGVSLSPCVRCGDCATGCNHNAKNSLDLNLLRLAARAGTRIVTGATVLGIKSLDYGSGGWLLYVNHTDRHLRDRQLKPFVIRSRRVILAAGTFGTTEILMRSRTLNLSREIGRKFSANGDMLVMAYGVGRQVNAVADETQDFSNGARKIGPTITAMIDLRKGDPKQDVVIQDLAIPGPLRRIFEESTTSFDVLNRLADGDFSTHDGNPLRPDDAAVNRESIGRTLIMAMIGRDDADGRLSFGARTLAENADGLLTVSWPELRLDSRFEAQHERLASLLDGKIETEEAAESGGPEKQKLGGRVVNNLLWRPLSEKMENVFGRQRGPLLTVHPLGGCSMGNNVREGVTDHCGRVFNAASRSPTDCYEGLVVLDGSFVPSSLGINPALTIAVLSLRALDRLKPQWQLTGGRLASPPGDASFSVQMRPPFAESVVKSDPIKTALELTEQIRGPVFLRAPDGKIRPHMVEITITTDMIEVDQLIGRDASKNREIDPGKGHLLAGRLFTLRKGRLRILRAGANFDFVSDEAYHGDVALSANLSGAVRMFSLERSRGCTRIFRALVAWFLNRGLRDIVQSAIERALEWVRYKPPTEHKKSAIRIVSDYIRDVIGLCSRAGAVRLIEYELWIDSVVSSGARHSKTTENDLKSAQSDKVGYFHRGAFEKKRIRGVKRLTYARYSSPWTQLTELSLTEFPQMRRATGRRVFRSMASAKTSLKHKMESFLGPWKGWNSYPSDPLAATYPPRLVLNTRYLARRSIPLIRVVRQENRIAALTDLLSFASYVLRVLLQTHAFTFRKPDPPPERIPQRLPGAVPGVPTCQIDWLTLRHRNEPVRIRLARYDGRKLTRYDGRKKELIAVPPRPVLAIHGYSASGTTFVHKAVPGNLTQTLCNAGRDVWLIDMRSSAGLGTATKNWAFEDMAKNDIPIAIEHILTATGAAKVDVVCHCMGAAMFSIALLGDHPQSPVRSPLHTKIGRAVFSQVGPVMMLSPSNVFLAYLMLYVRQFIPLQTYSFSPRGEPSAIDQLLDRALSATECPRGEYLRENPVWPPGRATPWVGSRHRMDALYSRTFSLGNLSNEVLDNFDDLFGPLSVDTVSQVIQFAHFNTVTDRTGLNCYVTPQRIRERFTFPLMSIHGEHNGLVDVATLALMRNTLKMAGVPHLNEYDSNSNVDPTTWAQTPAQIADIISRCSDELSSGTASYMTWRIAKHGHQDCLIGKDAHVICSVIANYLGVPDK